VRKDFGPLPSQFNRAWDDIARKSESAHREAPRSIPRSQWPEGHLANVAVYPSAPAAYAKMMAARDSAGGPECSRLDADGTLWVPLAWLTTIGLKVRA